MARRGCWQSPCPEPPHSPSPAEPPAPPSPARLKRGTLERLLSEPQTAPPSDEALVTFQRTAARALFHAGKALTKGDLSLSPAESQRGAGSPWHGAHGRAEPWPRLRVEPRGQHQPPPERQTVPEHGTGDIFPWVKSPPPARPGPQPCPSFLPAARQLCSPGWARFLRSGKRAGLRRFYFIRHTANVSTFCMGCCPLKTRRLGNKTKPTV